MISNKDLYKEIKLMDDFVAAEKDVYKKTLIKGVTLVIKLLHNLRTNTVAVMKHQGIELIKPREEGENTEGKEE